MLSEQPKETICETLKLPRDVLLGEMLISFVGRRQMVVENYRNLILYTDTCIRLQGKSGRLSVAGSRLVIDYYNSEEMKISGQIKSVEFE